MTTVRLPAEPQRMPSLTVDPAGIEDCGDQLRAASAQIDDLGTFLAGDARIDHWRGLASTSYHEAIRPMGRRADAMSLALRDVANAVIGHGATMRSLSERHEALESTRGVLSEGLAILRDDIARATAEDAVLQARADSLAANIEQYEGDHTAWTTRLEGEEAAMIATFDRVLTLEKVEQRYGGVPDPADDALAMKPGSGAPPEEVNAWWDSLSPAQQQAIIAAAPGSIGNLDGIPADARNDANTVSLDRDLADWRSLGEQGLLTDDEQHWLENAEAADDARDRIEDRFDPVTREPLTAQIYIYDPVAFDGDGAVAIAAGDLSTADNVSVIVPGFGTDASSAGSLGDRAANVYEAARFLDPDASSSTMFWIGYDAPDNLPLRDGLGADAAGVLTERLAAQGGDRLADTIDGLRSGRGGDPAHLTVIGHSYGSTTVGLGAHEHDLGVDDIVFVGSPGVGNDTEHAVDLNVDPDHVWAGENSHDVIANLGNHGSLNLDTFGSGGLGDDPAEDDFAGTRFQAESTTRGEGLDPTNDHTKYFDPNTESLYNLGQIVTGHYDDVQAAAPITDPWWSGPQDPEYDRDPTSPSTVGG